MAAPLVAPYAPDALDLANRRAAPSLAHWFGTDDLGRDTFSRALFGGRVSIAIGLLSALVAAGLGRGRGRGGRLRRRLDRHGADARHRRRAVGAAAAAADGGGGHAAAVGAGARACSSGAVGWMETARVTRAAVRSLLGAASSCWPRARSGAGHVRILWRHLLANAVGRDSHGRGAGGGPRDPGGIGAQLLWRGRAAAGGELGQHALPGAVGDDDRAVAGALSRARASCSPWACSRR